MTADEVRRRLAKAPLGSDGEQAIVEVLIRLAKALETVQAEQVWTDEEIVGLKAERRGAMPKAEPLKSEGGRLERKAVREKLRRMIRVVSAEESLSANYAAQRLNELLSWMLSRQKRFDGVVGGLGKKSR